MYLIFYLSISTVVDWLWFILFQKYTQSNHVSAWPWHDKPIDQIGPLWLLSHQDPIPIFVAASHQTRLDTRSKARRPIKVGIKGRGRSGRSRDSNPACLCCSSAHLVQCEPDEASSFTNPNVGPGTYAS